LGAIWRSGEPMYHPRMQQAFGLTGDEALVGLLYVGQPAMPQPEGKRRPVADKTRWITEHLT
ncbi:nitroreductase, partial [Paenibacillus validus]|nr:nitroreductase [Paenibacillus validus]